MKTTKYLLAAACLAGLSSTMAQTPVTPAAPPPPAPGTPSAAPDAPQAGYLGISTAPVPPPLSAQLKLEPGFGLLVVEVMPDSPAAQAGISANEVIVNLDDQILIEPNQLSTLVRSRKPGDTVALTTIKGGSRGTATVKLGERPADLRPARAAAFAISLPEGQTVSGSSGAAFSLPLPEGLGIRFDGDNVVVSGSSVTVIEEGGKTFQLIRAKDRKTFLVTSDKDGEVIFTKTLKTGDDADGIPEEYRKTFDRMDRDAPALPETGGATGAGEPEPVAAELFFQSSPPSNAAFGTQLQDVN